MDKRAVKDAGIKSDTRRTKKPARQPKASVDQRRPARNGEEFVRRMRAILLTDEDVELVNSRDQTPARNLDFD